MDLLNHSYLDIQESKQNDILITRVEILEPVAEVALSPVYEAPQRTHENQEQAPVVEQNVSGDVLMSERSSEGEEGKENQPKGEQKKTPVLRIFRGYVPTSEFITLNPDDVVDIFSNLQWSGEARIIDTNIDQNWVEFSSFCYVKPGVFIRYKPLEQQRIFLPLSQVTMGEIEDDYYGSTKLISGLRALDKYMSQFGRVIPRSQDAFKKFISFVTDYKDENREFYRKFFDTSAVPTFPINAITAGLISEEIVKFVGKIYPPASPVVGLHVLDFFYRDGLTPEDCSPSDDEYGLYNSAQILNFGNRVQQELSNKTALVLGAGALGSEYVKGAAMIGLASQGNSELIVVDNDSIMTSNVSRQLFFTEKDKNNPKAKILCERAKELLNPNTRMSPISIKLDHTTESQIGHIRLSRVDFLVSALDNVAARNVVDRLSLMYGKPMIDGGTEGLAGTQENFVPYVTREYLC